MNHRVCCLLLVLAAGCVTAESGPAVGETDAQGPTDEPSPAPRDGGRGKDAVDASPPSPDAAVPPMPDAGSDIRVPLPETLPRRSLGCGKPKTGTGTFVKQAALTIGGVSRTYFLWVPKSYDPSKPLPLLFTFHGAYGREPDPALPGANAIAEGTKGEAIVVAPNGARQASVSNTPGWDLKPGSVDLALFDAIRTSIADSHCIDEQRIFAHGFSMGAAFSLFLGCARGDVVRGIVVVDGAFRAPDVTPSPTSCKGHAAAWVVHGTQDTAVSTAIVTEAREALYLPRHGCATTSKPTSPSPCMTFDGCITGYPQVLCMTNAAHDPQTASRSRTVGRFCAGCQT